MYMSKYEHKADLSKIEVCKNLTGFLRSIQLTLKSGYRYYTSGHISRSRIVDVINKFDRYYDVCESSIDRTRRHKLNQPTVMLKLFFPQSRSENDVFSFILLARPGINESTDHPFFFREKYSDAFDRKHRINVNGYEFVRVNKEQYEFNSNEKSIKVPGVVGVWTIGLSDKYIKDTKQEYDESLVKNNWFNVNSIRCSLTRVLPFHKVRKDYYHMHRFCNERFDEVVKSQGLNKGYINLYPMPKQLGYMTAVKIFRLPLSEILNDESILKKVL